MLQAIEVTFVLGTLEPTQRSTFEETVDLIRSTYELLKNLFVFVWACSFQSICAGSTILTIKIWISQKNFDQVCSQNLVHQYKKCSKLGI